MKNIEVWRELCKALEIDHRSVVINESAGHRRLHPRRACEEVPDKTPLSVWLAGAFAWADQPQGHDYWRALHGIIMEMPAPRASDKGAMRAAARRMRVAQM
jgi:hypothetical protein